MSAIYAALQRLSNLDGLDAPSEGDKIKLGGSTDEALPLRAGHFLTPVSFGVGLTILLLLGLYLSLTNVLRPSELTSLFPMGDYVEAFSETKAFSDDKPLSQKPSTNATGLVTQSNLQIANSSQIDDPILIRSSSIQKFNTSGLVNTPVNPKHPEQPKQPKHPEQPQDFSGQPQIDKGQPLSSVTQVNRAKPIAAVSKLQDLQSIRTQVAVLNSAIRGFAKGNDTAAKLVDMKLATLEQSLNPENLMLLRMQAYWAQKQGYTAEALATYNVILVINPGDMQANLNVALLELNMGDEQRAKRRLDALEDTHPDSMDLIKFKQQVMAHHGT